MMQIVTATRFSEDDFWKYSALGISLKRLDPKRFIWGAAFDNSAGLPEIYNHFLLDDSRCDTIVFIHDDVWIDDYFLIDRVSEGLKAYDVIGVAGNRRRLPFQPAWGFADRELHWDQEHLSGAIAEGKHPAGQVKVAGITPAECELLDGVFLAAKKAVLKSQQVFFDPRFNFHFYDMDFCRTARLKGLRLGTWPICLTHQGTGLFGTPQWQENYTAYLEKWGS